MAPPSKKIALLRVTYWFPDYGPLVFAGDEGSLQKRWLNIKSAFLLKFIHHSACHIAYKIN